MTTRHKTATILGCGYVGQAVTRRWQAKGKAVTATTTTPSRLPLLEAVAQRAVQVSGSDPDGLQQILEHETLLLVSVGAKRRDGYRDAYLKTAETLAPILPHTAVTQVIYTGSYAVYGDRQGRCVTEADPPAPANSNGEILAQTEQVLLGTATPERAVCVLRLGGIYGPGRELVKIFRQAAGSTRPGAGDDAVNWIHLDDIVAAIDFAQQQRLDGLYNLVQDDPPTAAALLEHVMQTHNLPTVQWDASSASTRPYNARVSNQKLKQAGYRFLHPKFSFQA
ncbi:MAG: NAD-dependent epimerase/dehydratase family protein [Cyanobacteria bacterium P01_A01_bin.135]